MTPPLVILMPTFDRYRWLADFSARWLDRWWPSHPPLWRCGCSQDLGPRDLPLQRDSRDWMGIALDAARAQAEQGVRQAYVILDDLPPLGVCHAEHLDATLPAWMDELDAGCIGLNGWGQGRLPAGTDVDPRRLDLQRVTPDFAWRFPLHPTLWNLTAFIEILEAMTRTEDLKRRSAWAFERRAPETAGTPAEQWSRRAYRVCGRRMAAPAYRPRGRMFQWSLRRATGAAHGAAGLLGAKKMEDAIQRDALWLHRDYIGPYPLVHSGLMAQGRPNPFFLRYMRAFGDRAMLADFDAACRDAGVAS